MAQSTFQGSSHKSADIAAWWQEDIGDKLTPVARHIFTDWSGLKDDEIEERIYAVRSKAWKLRKYPCIGQFHFLTSRLPHFAEYPQVLERVKTGASVMDLGCCFGQDLRQLAADGAPTENLVGIDIDDELWYLGYELFNDRSKMKARFMRADILDDAGAASPLHDFCRKMDVIFACGFLHLFSWYGQRKALKRIISFSRPGAQVIGYNISREDGEAGEILFGESEITAPNGQNPYHHSPETFRETWEDLAEVSGTEWDVKARSRPLSEWELGEEDVRWMGPLAVGVEFVATRLS